MSNSGCQECPICYDAITSDTGSTRLSCSHSFHLKCIANWIIKSETCPCCRKEVSDHEKLSDINLHRPRALSYEGNTTTWADWIHTVPILQLPPRIQRQPYAILNPEAPEFIPQEEYNALYNMTVNIVAALEILTEGAERNDQ
jgi:hypothetical protein